MAAGRKGHLEGPSISHGAPHTRPGDPGVAKEKDPNFTQKSKRSSNQTFKCDCP